MRERGFSFSRSLLFFFGSTESECLIVDREGKETIKGMDDLDSAQTCYFLVVASRKATTTASSSACLHVCLSCSRSLSSSQHHCDLPCNRRKTKKKKKKKKKKRVITQVGLELESLKATFCMFLSLAIYRNKTIVDGN